MRATILGLLLTLAFAAPTTGTDTYGYSVMDCWLGGYHGGVQLHNGDGFTGGDRVMCFYSGSTQDPWFEHFLYPPNDWDVRDIGSFDDKTESITIWADAFCRVNIKFYDKTVLRDFLSSKQLDNRQGPDWEMLDIEITTHDNKFSSMEVWVGGTHCG